MLSNLHPVFQQALAPFLANGVVNAARFSEPRTPEFIQAIRDKLDEEYACGMDSIGRGYDEDDSEQEDGDE